MFFFHNQYNLFKSYYLTKEKNDTVKPCVVRPKINEALANYNFRSGPCDPLEKKHGRFFKILLSI